MSYVTVVIPSAAALENTEIKIKRNWGTYTSKLKNMFLGKNVAAHISRFKSQHIFVSKFPLRAEIYIDLTEPLAVLDYSLSWLATDQQTKAIKT